MQAERRRSTRIGARFLVEWDAGDFFAPAEASDISPHGLAIDTTRPGQVSQLIRVRLYLPDGDAPLECYSWIRWQKGGAMGLQLFAMSDAERTRWTAYYLDCYRREHRQAACPAPRTKTDSQGDQEIRRSGLERPPFRRGVLMRRRFVVLLRRTGRI